MGIFYLLLLVIGFAALVRGADVFVSGSSALARYFNVPDLIIGLTIVALGTSAPELAVSTSAALQGSNEIALSNVIGSNLFNLLCVLGICAIIYPLPVERSVLRRDFPFSIFATVLLLSACSSMFLRRPVLRAADQEVGVISRNVGLMLLLLFAGYIAYLIYAARKNADEDAAGEKESLGKCAALIAAGLVMIAAGGKAVVYSAVEIARIAGLSETLIGLTIVALGTSLPELVTSIVAARKGETELAIGNVIGSNIFNLLFILGISSMIHPIAVNMASLCDLVILLFISVLSFFFSLSSRKIVWSEGLVMVGIYIADVAFAVIR